MFCMSFCHEFPLSVWAAVPSAVKTSVFQPSMCICFQFQSCLRPCLVIGFFLGVGTCSVLVFDTYVLTSHLSHASNPVFLSIPHIPYTLLSFPTWVDILLWGNQIWARKHAFSQNGVLIVQMWCWRKGSHRKKIKISDFGLLGITTHWWITEEHKMINSQVLSEQGLINFNPIKGLIV